MKRLGLLLVVILFSYSCSGPPPEHSSEELAQQMGDVMASIDEFSVASETTFSVVPLQEPRCLDFVYSDCTTRGQKVRTFNDCTVQNSIFAGSATFQWSNTATCALAAPLESIVRIPNIRVTGRRDSNLTIKKAGSYGQRLTWVSGTGPDKVFTFESDGIDRIFKTETGLVNFSHTSTTLSPLFVSGTSRGNRILNSGTLRIRDNLNLSYCDYTPENVEWTASCNCPTKGTWSGSCSNENLTRLTITGCGTGIFEDGAFTENVVFDRCGL